MVIFSIGGKQKKTLRIWCIFLEPSENLSPHLFMNVVKMWPPSLDWTLCNMKCPTQQSSNEKNIVQPLCYCAILGFLGGKSLVRLLVPMFAMWVIDHLQLCLSSLCKLLGFTQSWSKKPSCLWVLNSSDFHIINPYTWFSYVFLVNSYFVCFYSPPFRVDPPPMAPSGPSRCQDEGFGPMPASQQDKSRVVLVASLEIWEMAHL